jgi:hypothetical protein
MDTKMTRCVPLAWRYRDYVVRSLNSDKPYDRFVQEQLAGDELWPDNPMHGSPPASRDSAHGTGCRRSREKQRQDFLNDATDATGSVFLGITLGCAPVPRSQVRRDHTAGLLRGAGIFRFG